MNLLDNYLSVRKHLDEEKPENYVFTGNREKDMEKAVNGLDYRKNILDQLIENERKRTLR